MLRKLNCRSADAWVPAAPRDASGAGPSHDVAAQPLLPQRTLPDRPALAHAVDRVVDVARRPPPPSASQEESTRWQVELSQARLATAREYSAIHHEAPMPPEPANQLHALLERGAALIDQASKEALADPGRRSVLHAALLQGKHFNRCTRHLDLPPGKLPRLEYALANFGHDHVAVTVANPDGIGTRVLQVWPTERDHVGTMAHESVHVGQHHGGVRPDPFAWRPQPSRHPARAPHPRGGMLEAARGSPTFKARFDRPDLSSAHKAQAARSAPREIQAHVEQAALLSLMPLLDASCCVDAAATGSDFERLGRLIHRAAKTLKASGDMLEAAVCLPPTTVNYTPAKGPQAAAMMEYILFAAARIEDAMRSKAWTPDVAARWKTALRQLSTESTRTQRQPPTDHRPFEVIAAALSDFLNDLARRHGHAVHSPADVEPDSRAFGVAKQDPVAALAVVLATIESQARPGRRPEPNPERLGAELRRLKEGSGFVMQVEALKRSIASGQSPTPPNVRDVVMSLAAPLLGLDPDAMPEDLRPVVHLFDAPSMDLDHIAGLNLASHQRRKASFEVATWMLHLPRQLFDEPDKLEDRLCGLAVDVAYPAAAVLAHADPRRSDPAGGLVPTWSGQTVVDLTQGLYTHAKGHADDFIRSHPHSAAAVLRAIVEGTPVKDTQRIWHEGWRRDVKASASDDTLEPTERRVALEAYQSRARQRWDLPAVAFRRALIGARP